MATITVRVDDATRDALQAKAEEERQSLSDFVRDRLNDAVFGFRSEEEPKKTGGLEPESLSALERHQLALLHRILARVLPEDANDVDGDKDFQLERAKVLERGYTSEYWVEYASIHPELNARHCDFVNDALELFRIASISIAELRKEGVEVDESLERALTFEGFDHNDRLENQMAGYVQFLVEDEKWTEQKDVVFGPDRGNSHSQMLPVYSRMLTVFREVKQNPARKASRRSYLLKEHELRKIAAARVHPSRQASTEVTTSRDW
jgi:uncharacterized protein YfbU (UPF0304 family)